MEGPLMTRPDRITLVSIVGMVVCAIALVLVS
jgi:hypothetical protein